MKIRIVKPLNYRVATLNLTAQPVTIMSLRDVEGSATAAEWI